MRAEEYRNLILAYLNLEITVTEFETQYLTALKNEPDGMLEELFRILNELFLDLDAYSSLWVPEEENGLTRITESTLRSRATKALAKLDKFFDQKARNR